MFEDVSVIPGFNGANERVFTFLRSAITDRDVYAS
jgi:hypothetical protein